MKNNFRVVNDIVFITIKCQGKKYETLVSRNKLEKLMKFDVKWYGFIDRKSGYIYVRCNYKDVNGKWKQMQLHRYLMDDPEGLVVDHRKSGLTLLNTDANLRITTQKVNTQNKKGANKNSKTGVRGVSFNEVDKKYKASIGVDGEVIYLGSFDSIEEAYCMRLEAEQIYFEQDEKEQPAIPEICFENDVISFSEYLERGLI